MRTLINNIINIATDRFMRSMAIACTCLRRVYTTAVVCVLLVSVCVAQFSLFGQMETAYAAFNKEINYQGKLTNSSNVAVPDGTYHMRFKLYTVATGGVSIWDEDRSTAAGDRITVTNGLFSVMLGSSTPLTSVDFNQTLYLGVEVGGSGGSPSWDGEMTPRKKLGAVPAAFVADTVDGLSSEQFLRADATNATNTASTFLTITQNGAGDIANFVGPSSASVLAIRSGGNVGIGTSSPFAKLSVAGRVVAEYFTATGTTASVLPYASSTAFSVSGTGYFGTASTTNFTISGISGCSGSNALTTDASGVVACGAISGGSAFPFTPATNFGVNTSATSTPIWAQNGLYASSTSQFAAANFYGSVGVGTSSPWKSFSVAGDAVFGGAIYAATSSGINGMVLQTTGSSVQWVATSSLGISTTGSGGPSMMGAGGAGASLTVNQFCTIVGTISCSATQAFRETALSSAGTISNFTLRTQASNVGSEAVVTLFKNGSACGTPADVSVTIPTGGSASTFTDSTNTCSVVAGDRISVKITGGSPAAGLVNSTVFSFQPASSVESGLVSAGTAGQFAYYGSSGNTISGQSSLYYSSENIGVGTSSPYATLSVVGQTVAAYFTATTSTASVLPYASSTAFSVSGTGYFGTASTTNLTISGISGCSGSNALTTNSSGVVACGAITGSGGAFPFTPATNFGVNTSATSTPIWAQNGLYASSTSQFAYATATALTVTGTTYLGTTYMSGALTWAGGYGLSSSGNNLTVDLVQGFTTDNSLTLQTMNFTVAGNMTNMSTGTFSNSSGVGTAVAITPTYSQSSTAAGTDLLINRTETAVGSGPQYFANFQVGGSSRFVFTSAGNLGVGSTTPWAKLSVGSYGGTQPQFVVASSTGSGATSTSFIVDQWGNVAIGSSTVPESASANGTKLYVYSASSGTTASTLANDLVIEGGGSLTTGISILGSSARSVNIFFGDENDNDVAGISYANSVDQLRFFANASLAQVISSTGNTGFSTTSPWARLSVGAANSTGPLFAVASSSTGIATSTLFIVDGNGNVGVGTTSPYAKLSVVGEVVGSYFTATGTTASSTFAGGIVASGGGVRISTLTNCNGASVLETDANGVISCGADAGGAGSSPGGADGQLQYNDGGTFGGALDLVWDDVNSRLGVGTSSPWAKLSIANSNGSVSTPLFAIGTSTGSAATSTAFIVNAFGNVGIGTSSPWGGTRLLVQQLGAGSGQNTPNTAADDVVIDGERDTGLTILNTSNFSGNIYFGDQNDAAVGGIKYNHASDYMSFTVNGSEAQRITSTGNVGIGTTSPYAKLSVVGQVAAEYFTATSSNATSTFAGRMIIGSGQLYPSTILQIGSSTNSYLQANIQNTNSGNAASTDWVATNDLGSDTKYYVDLGINSSTYNQAAYSIVGANDAYLYSSDSNLAIGTASTTGNANIIFHTAGTQSSNERMRITSTGNVGIGSTTPYAKLSVVGGGNNGTFPSFVVATTSAWGAGQRPLLFVTATTTGKLDYARVAIGTTSPWGTSGLRDQLTVDGRIYSTWRYLSCDLGGSGGGVWSSDAAGACGDFSFDFDTDGTSVLTRTAYPPAIQLTAGSTNATVGDGSALRTTVMAGSATSSPIFEAWVQPSRPATATSSPLYIVGMINNAFGADLGTTMPSQGAYFIATSTPNWRIVTRSASNVETITDSGLATSSTNMSKMRIELTTTEATFLLNGNVVAVHATNIPTATLQPIAQVGIFANGGTNASTLSLFVSLMRFWMDDPVGGTGQTGFASLMGSGEDESESTTLSQEDVDNYQTVSAAAVTAPYLVGNPKDYIEGSVVSFHEEDRARVRLSNGEYDANTFGVVGMTSVQNLGETNEHTINVAVSGRVPVRISLENGDINPGDYITSSSIPGVAMKATASGPVIGRAIQKYNEDMVAFGDTIMVSVEPGYFTGTMLVQNSDGNVGIGTTTDSFAFSVLGDVGTRGVGIFGKRSAMMDVSDLTAETENSYLDAIKNISISTYRYKDEEANAPLRLGIIADQAPSEILSVSGEDVDVYKLAVLTLGGVKALENKFSGLDARVTALENQIFGVASSTATSTATSTVVADDSFFDQVLSYFEGLGTKISDGVAHFASVITSTLTVGSGEKPSGITLYDEVTGEPYCLKISNGKMKSERGECTVNEIVDDEEQDSGATSEDVAEDSTEADSPSEVSSAGEEDASSEGSDVVSRDEKEAGENEEGDSEEAGADTEGADSEGGDSSQGEESGADEEAGGDTGGIE